MTQTFPQCDIYRVPGYGTEPLSRNVAAEGNVGSSSLTILHFNDVYEVREREKEPVGGVARFKTKINLVPVQDPLVLFSGDALSPSNSESFYSTADVHITSTPFSEHGNQRAAYGVRSQQTRRQSGCLRKPRLR